MADGDNKLWYVMYCQTSHIIQHLDQIVEEIVVKR